MNNSTVNFSTSKASTNISTSALIEIGVFEYFVLGFSSLLGVPVHFCATWVIATGIRAVPDFLKLNLSVCRLLFSMNSLLILLTKWITFPSLMSLIQFMFGLAITGCPLFQCLICVESFLAVVHPVIFLKLKPLRYKVICCAVVWIITLGSCIMCVLSFHISTLYMYVWFCSVQFLLYLSVQMFCCVSALKALKHSGPGERVREREREEENDMKRQACKLILIVVVATIITYVPITVTGFLTAVTTHLFQVLLSVSYFIFAFTGLVSPFFNIFRFGNLSCLSICKK